MTNCTQQGCNVPATRVVYWPGKVPPPTYCLYHAVIAMSILNAMGINVVVEDIEND